MTSEKKMFAKGNDYQTELELEQKNPQMALSYVFSEWVASQLNDHIEDLYTELLLQIAFGSESNGKKHEKRRRIRKSFIRSRY